ncbi:hypothetical protein B0H17DRAFT_1217098 [Mycena rosella]|uniref:DUF6534 domain-containing protein n=1 Tax=Mycena rosella TaxID=1033263 RepID=A0AAD7C2R0_MYCRO|nr:hypothetical protein B0H17DRAFT_1217098 [Mycena rosella]
MTDVSWTLGALLIGGSIALLCVLTSILIASINEVTACSLSGMITVQCIIFFKLYYPNEIRSRICMVVAVWILDLLHSAFIVTTLFSYFIHFFGDRDHIDHIPLSVALSILITAVQTLYSMLLCAKDIQMFNFVLCFCLSYRRSSERGKAVDNTAYSFSRSFSVRAFVVAVEMIRLHRYSAFSQKYPGWVLTTALSLAASVDILIIACLCSFLRKIRQRSAFTLLAQVVDTLTLYTLENGVLTCLTTTASLICWVTIPENLIFLGLHFVIGKLYANSLLLSLNTRKELREMHWKKSDWGPSGPVVVPADFNMPCSPISPAYDAPYSTTHPYTAAPHTPGSAYRPAFKVNPRVLPSQLEISVERTTERSSEDLIRQYHRSGSPRHSGHTVEPWGSLP